MAERTQTSKIICQGGLRTSQNYLDLSDNAPGAAVQLINFEPSLFGGYRRINGFNPLEEFSPDVDNTNAEGKILGVFVYNGDIIAARKQKSGATYKFYQWVTGNNWSPYTTGFTHVSSAVDKIRYAVFNFDGTPKIIFVDGINKATIFDGTTWTQVDSANTGATYADAGGDQAVNAPSYVTIYKNHIFIAGDPTAPGVVVHSAPGSEYDWTAAGGAGQIVAGLEVVQIKPWRDFNYVFGKESIKYISVEGTDFTIKDVTQNIGCVASDSVQEIGGDLVFLSQDGVRPIGGTSRIGDVQLETVSKEIQSDIISLIASHSSNEINSVVIRRKSQVRFFFNTAAVADDLATGIIGGLRGNGGNIGWEWGHLKGIKVSCATSGYIDNNEFVLHGGHDGVVYRQELGNTFNGSPIFALYRTPFLDFGDTEYRKTFRNINLFIRPEGPFSVTTQLIYDWGLPDRQNPTVYVDEETIDFSLYGEGEYGTAVYAEATVPVRLNNVEGSGFSVQCAFTNTNATSYTIQGVIFEYSVNGRI